MWALFVLNILLSSLRLYSWHSLFGCACGHYLLPNSLGGQETPWMWACTFYFVSRCQCYLFITYIASQNYNQSWIRKYQRSVAFLIETISTVNKKELWCCALSVKCKISGHSQALTLSLTLLRSALWLNILRWLSVFLVDNTPASVMFQHLTLYLCIVRVCQPGYSDRYKFPSF